MNLDLGAFVIPIVALAVLLLVTRWTSDPSRRRERHLINGAELGALDLIAVDLSLSETLELRAKLGELGIQTSVAPRGNGVLDVFVFHEDINAARAVLNH